LVGPAARPEDQGDVLSPESYNSKVGLVIPCPITGQAKAILSSRGHPSGGVAGTGSGPIRPGQEPGLARSKGRIDMCLADRGSLGDTPQACHVAIAIGKRLPFNKPLRTQETLLGIESRLVTPDYRLAPLDSGLVTAVSNLASRRVASIETVTEGAPLASELMLPGGHGVAWGLRGPRVPPGNG
jgi:hypothetical protein